MIFTVGLFIWLLYSIFFIAKEDLIMISSNQLIQMACELCSLVEAGESVDGNMAVVGINLLNNLIADLNSKNYIVMQNATIDVPCRRLT